VKVSQAADGPGDGSLFVDDDGFDTVAKNFIGLASSYSIVRC